jgi:hypothetical protein
VRVDVGGSKERTSEKSRKLQKKLQLQKIDSGGLNLFF